MPESLNESLEENGWESYHRLVMSELARHKEDLSGLAEKLDKTQENLNTKLDQIRTTDLPSIRTDIATLKVKSGVWGGLAGVITGLIPILTTFIMRLISK